jgi:hypothetical protein
MFLLLKRTFDAYFILGKSYITLITAYNTTHEAVTLVTASVAIDPRAVSHLSIDLSIGYRSEIVWGFVANLARTRIFGSETFRS